MLYLKSFPIILILENTNLEDIPQVTPKEKEIRETKHELEVEDIIFSPCIEFIECLGADESHEIYFEHIGYIIKFEPILNYKFTPNRKPMIAENRGIEPKRIEARMRKEMSLLTSTIWEWDTFPWDPGGKVDTN